MSPHIQLLKEGHRCQPVEFRGPLVPTWCDCWKDKGLSWQFGSGAARLRGEPGCFGEGWVVCREKGACVLSADQLHTPGKTAQVEREGPLGRWLLAASLLASLREKPAVLALSTDFLWGVNSLVLVKQLMQLTAVPGGVRTNYQLMWAVK